MFVRLFKKNSDGTMMYQDEFISASLIVGMKVPDTGFSAIRLETEGYSSDYYISEQDFKKLAGI